MNKLTPYIKRCKYRKDLNQWEIQFLNDISNLEELTQTQQNKLLEIFNRKPRYKHRKRTKRNKPVILYGYNTVK